MTAACRGWCLTLADGRRYAYTEHDGIHTEAQARARLAAWEPDARVVGVEEEEIVLLIELGTN